jgi:hydrogenase nickel incorporation protein HypA/HybF
MHELAITKTLIDMILRESKRPKKVIVELGMLTSYKKEPIEFYFDILKKEYPALKSTELIIVPVPGRLKCNDCKKTSEITEPYLIFCDKCSSGNIELVNGKDLILKEITF